MIKAKQLADRLPAELLPENPTWPALLSAITQLKTERNNALVRVEELEKALLKICYETSDTDSIIDIAYDALNGEV